MEAITSSQVRAPGSPPSLQGQLGHIYFPVENNLIAFLERAQNASRLFQLTKKITLVIFQVICVFFI